jgi:hypothetical protein
VARTSVSAPTSRAWRRRRRSALSFGGTSSLELAVRDDELAYGPSLFRVLGALPVTLA